jgi:alkylhydroperoxidase/carboxymuconolactone decarboxylase family protein YurZ
VWVRHRARRSTQSLDRERDPAAHGALVFTAGKENNMTTRKKIQVDFEYEEVLDAKTRRLIQVGCAVAAGCPT